MTKITLQLDHNEYQALLKYTKSLKKKCSIGEAAKLLIQKELRKIKK